MLSVVPLKGIPEIEEGTDLAACILAALEAAGERLEDGDVLVVSSKVMSKARGLRLPDDGPASHEGIVRRHSVRVVAERRTVDGVTRVVQAVSGPTLTAAGVDASNTGGAGGFLTLPEDPDRCAQELRRELGLQSRRVAVVVSDTAGRPWRVGQTDFALGAAGLITLEDLRGHDDHDGRALSVTARAIGDEIAAAADLVKGKASHIPVVLVRGAGDYVAVEGVGATELTRPPSEDWFSHGTKEAVRASLGIVPGSTDSANVGLACLGPEPTRVRMERAVAVALFGTRPADIELDGLSIRVTSADLYEQGRVIARLEVALWGEGLASAIDGAPGSPLTLSVTER